MNGSSSAPRLPSNIWAVATACVLLSMESSFLARSNMTSPESRNLPEESVTSTPSDLNKSDCFWLPPAASNMALESFCSPPPTSSKLVPESLAADFKPERASTVAPVFFAIWSSSPADSIAPLMPSAKASKVYAAAMAITAPLTAFMAVSDTLPMVSMAFLAMNSALFRSDSKRATLASRLTTRLARVAMGDLFLFAQEG